MDVFHTHLDPSIPGENELTLILRNFRYVGTSEVNFISLKRIHSLTGLMVDVLQPINDF